MVAANGCRYEIEIAFLTSRRDNVEALKRAFLLLFGTGLGRLPGSFDLQLPQLVVPKRDCWRTIGPFRLPSTLCLRNGRILCFSVAPQQLKSLKNKLAGYFS